MDNNNQGSCAHNNNDLMSIASDEFVDARSAALGEEEITGDAGPSSCTSEFISISSGSAQSGSEGSLFSIGSDLLQAAEEEGICVLISSDEEQDSEPRIIN